MKKLLTLSLLLFACVASAQENLTEDINKMLNNKSFVFVATASLGGSPATESYWQNIYPSAPELALEKDVSINKFLWVLSTAQGKNGVSNTQRSKGEVFPAICVQEGSALFHPSILQPAYNQLRGLNPDSLNNPLIMKNYSIKTNKKGRIFVNFQVDGRRFGDQPIKLVISPDGKAEMWIAGSAINRGQPSKSYKGYIQPLASL